MWRRVTSSECPKTAAPTPDTTDASAAPVRVPATPSREPITAAVTAAAVLATIWMTDRPNLPAPPWSLTAVAAADPAVPPVAAVAAVAGVIFRVGGSGGARRGTGERPGRGGWSRAVIEEVSRVRCRPPVDGASVGRYGPTATSAPAHHRDARLRPTGSAIWGQSGPSASRFDVLVGRLRRP